MVKLKIYGIFSLFLFSLPKFFSSTPQQETTIPEEPKQIVYLPKLKKVLIPVKTIDYPKPIQVSASVYFPEVAQTDSTPFITADGSKINKKKPGKHRWIAVSRNLLRRWGGNIDYGDTLRVKGISPKLDGHYIVRDTMTKRMKNRIDILVGEKDDIMGFWNNVKIYHIN